MIPFKYVAGDHCWESYIALKGLIDKEVSVNLEAYLLIIIIINKKIKPIDNMY